MSVSKPKHAGVREPNKQKYNRQDQYYQYYQYYYQYYRNEYNLDKNKRRNIYRYNNGHTGEQQVYDRNPRQDNFSNVITFQQTNSNHQNNESEKTGHMLVEVLTTIIDYNNS